ncbi:MAG: gliding motility-associated C-terminal domain-containing protein [Bacteroidetes bacterium]|nr:gliding motility-associated C-terminal domain-containing protein [Bacteroidota bacterium]
MKKFYNTLILLAGIFLAAEIPAQVQTSTGCPGVPGACGYHHTNNNNANHSGPNQTPQDGNGSLGSIYSNTECGLNFTTASQRLGQRFSPAGIAQPAPFVISGIPACATIDKAFLWAEGSGNGAAQTATVNGPLGSANYPMTISGAGPDKCWGYVGSYTYRADISASVNGNGTYNVSGLWTSLTSGSANDMDGATLMIIYSDPTQTYQGNIYISDGAIIIGGGATSSTLTYPAVCGTASNVIAFGGFGDIQMAVNSLDLNGTPDPITWNWWNFEQVNSTLAVGQTSSLYDISTGGDCYNFCIAGLYFQTSCSTCTPSASSITATGSSTAATCSACDGTATVTPSPAGSYTYSWTPGGQTTQTATGLCPGSYTVTVTGTCATATQVVTVTSNGNLSGSAAVTNIPCANGNNGSITVTPSGGTGPYTYAWTPNVGSGATVGGLAAGTYTCTVTDANGCTFNQVSMITQPAALSSTSSNTSPACNGQATGTASVTVSGGTPAYTYSWSPSGGSGAGAINLPAGNYSVTVVDANGCVITQTLAITEPPALTLSMTAVPAGCNGQGSATATVGGGTPGYTYSWSSGGTAATEPNLNPGTYTVTITDANGCTIIDSATITSSTPITIAASQTDLSCFAGNNGSATATPSGGTGPYTYSWSPSGGNAQTANNLAAGQYTCTITDAAGCTATQTFTITSPTALNTTATSVNESCFGQSIGSGTVNVSGGTGPYVYAWTPSGGNAATASNLAAGTYTVTASDANGCIITQTVQVTQPTLLTVAMTPDSSCAGGPVTLNSSGGGGTGPYTYSWSNGANTASTTFNLLASTTLTVIVTDANGCTTTGIASASLLPSPVAAFTVNDINGYFILGSGDLCPTDITNGSVAWSWNFNGTGSSNIQNPCVTLTPGDTGSYCITLTTSNVYGCLDTTNTCIEITNISYFIPNVFTPNADGTNDIFTITNEGMKSLRCEIYNRWGELIYEWDSTSGGWDGKTKNGSLASDGVYYYTAHLVDYTDKIYDESGFLHLIKDKQ